MVNSRIDAAGFEQERKGRELCDLLEAYEAELAARGLVDTAECLRRAAAEVSREPLLWSARVVLLVPEDLRLTRLERDLLSAFPATRRLELPVDQPVLDASSVAAEPRPMFSTLRTRPSRTSGRCARMTCFR